MDVNDLLDTESNILGKELVLWAMRREGSDIRLYNNLKLGDHEQK